jgi:Skp family chaperone for outer membrane proteins
MMHKLKLVIMTCVMVGVASLTQAQLNVAVFDATEVMANTNAAKRAAETLETRLDAGQKQIAELEKPLLEKQKQLRDQASVMAPDKAKTAQAEFAKELAEFRRKAQEIQGLFDAENAKLRARITDGVRSVVAELAKERKYDLILPKSLVFYSSTSVPDITADVLSRANTLLDK